MSPTGRRGICLIRFCEREVCMIRRAELCDIPAVAAIYDAIHAEEEAGRMTVGWILCARTMETGLEYL